MATNEDLKQAFSEALEKFLREMLCSDANGRRLLERERDAGVSPSTMLNYIIQTCPPECERMGAILELHRDEAERIIAGFLGYV